MPWCCTSCVASLTFVVAERIGQNLCHALLGSNTKGKSTNDETPERRFVAVLDRQSLRDVGKVRTISVCTYVSICMYTFCMVRTPSQTKKYQFQMSQNSLEHAPLTSPPLPRKYNVDVSGRVRCVHQDQPNGTALQIFFSKKILAV